MRTQPRGTIDSTTSFGTRAPASWIALVLVTGCGGVYRPSATNVPLFRRGGELSIAGHAGSNGLDAQGAYSPLDGLGMLASFSRADERDHEHHYGELAVGAYPWLVSPSGLRFAVEAFGGVGIGTSTGTNLRNEDEERVEYEAGGSFWRAFLQTDVALQWTTGAFGLATRVSYLRYSYDEGPAELGASSSGLVLEPIFVFRLGSERLMVEAQWGPILTNLGEHGLAISDLHVSLGARFIIDGGDTDAP